MLTRPIHGHTFAAWALASAIPDQRSMSSATVGAECSFVTDCGDSHTSLGEQRQKVRLMDIPYSHGAVLKTPLERLNVVHGHTLLGLDHHCHRSLT